MDDSGEGDGSGEQTDIAAAQSESTDGNEERGVGRAEAVDNEGHHGKSSTVQATADTSQQVSGYGLGASLLLLLLLARFSGRSRYLNLAANLCTFCVAVVTRLI